MIKMLQIPVLEFLEKMNLNFNKSKNHTVPLSFEKSNQIIKELMKFKEFSFWVK